MMRAISVLLWLVSAVLLLLPLFRPARLPRGRRPAPTDELVKDPVCQTYVLRSHALTRGDGADLHYFCSADCARRYAASFGG